VRAWLPGSASSHNAPHFRPWVGVFRPRGHLSASVNLPSSRSLDQFRVMDLEVRRDPGVRVGIPWDKGVAAQGAEFRRGNRLRGLLTLGRWRALAGPWGGVPRRGSSRLGGKIRAITEVRFPDHRGLMLLFSIGNRSGYRSPVSRSRLTRLRHNLRSHKPRGLCPDAPAPVSSCHG
jgi:hypothetical protein